MCNSSITPFTTRLYFYLRIDVIKPEICVNCNIHKLFVLMIHYATIFDSVQALEYLLWASISLELSITLMTAKYLPWIVTLYCAVCHCYYDNHDAVQAEVKHTLPASRHLQTDKHPLSTEFSHILGYEYQLLPVDFRSVCSFWVIT